MSLLLQVDPSRPGKEGDIILRNNKPQTEESYVFKNIILISQ